MRVLAVDPDPFSELPALNAAGRGHIESIRVPFLRGTVDALPRDLDALVATADLQALEDPRSGLPQRPIGEVVAEHLDDLARAGEIPSPTRTGVLLAGDFYTVPDLARRGGSGDVRSTWRAFAERFRWVAGVAGNRDTFEGRLDGVHLLDGEIRELDGLRMGGVAGILGDPAKLNRQAPDVFCEKIERVLLERADVLVLHEGPDVPAETLRGSACVRATLEEARHRALVVCGHTWWPVTLAELAGGVQVLKVDGRVVVLERA